MSIYVVLGYIHCYIGGGRLLDNRLFNYSYDEGSGLGMMRYFVVVGSGDILNRIENVRRGLFDWIEVVDIVDISGIDANGCIGGEYAGYGSGLC